MNQIKGEKQWISPLSDHIHSEIDISTDHNNNISSSSSSSSSSSGSSIVTMTTTDSSSCGSSSTHCHRQQQQHRQQQEDDQQQHPSRRRRSNNSTRRKIRRLTSSSSLSQSSHFFIKLKFVIVLLSLFHLNTNESGINSNGRDCSGSGGSSHGHGGVYDNDGMNIGMGMGIGIGLSSVSELQILPLFGKVFVAAATTSVRTNRRNEDENNNVSSASGEDEKRRQLHSNTNSYDRGPMSNSKSKSKVLNVNAAPDVPIARRTRQNATNLLKTFNFRGKQAPPPQPPQPPSAQVTFSEILKKAGKSGIGGGIPGAIAGIIQVLTLMWLRTVMNYQCRYGSTFLQSVRSLYNQGGIPRFYRGLSFALVQAPLARFVATAANDGVETLLANLKCTRDWGAGRSTVIASMVVGMWRIFLMPIDTCKTVLQVDSVDGFRNLMRKVKAGKVYVLYQGTCVSLYVCQTCHIALLSRSGIYLLID